MPKLEGPRGGENRVTAEVDFYLKLETMAEEVWGRELAPLRVQSVARDRMLCSLGASLGVEFSETWTCYEGDGHLHCGECGACVERKEAFASAGVADPTYYKTEES